MAEWKRVSDEDAAKIKSGGAWCYRDGKLVRVSMQVITESIRDSMPGWIQTLAARMSLTSLSDIQDMSFTASDDLTSVTVELVARGRIERQEFPISSGVIS